MLFSSFYYTHLRKPLFYVLKRFFCLFPVRDKVVFSCFNGKGFGDNPAAIAQEILHQGLSWKMVWLVTDVGCVLPRGIEKVEIHSIKALWEMSTAKLIVTNVKNGLPFLKRKSQYYIQTWHGMFPLKFIEGECESLLDPGYVAGSKKDSADTDLLLSGCGTDSEIYRKFFWYDGEIFEHGLPRCDMLFQDNTAAILSVRRELGIPEGKRIVLYAPTFRDDGDTSAYRIDADAVLNELQKKTGEDWVLVIRLHPNVTDSDRMFNYSDRVVNGSKLANPQHMVAASDILITDYSSIMVDFCLLSKPVFLFATDLEKFKKTRGLRDIYYKLPFSRSSDNGKLIESIRDFSASEYQNQLDSFIKKTMRNFNDGHASEKVVERMVSFVNGTFGGKKKGIIG